MLAAADGGGGARRAVSARRLTDWSANGTFVGITPQDDIWTARDGEPARTFFTSTAVEWYATFSPDGRWLAYSSKSGATEEVFVRPYPGPDPALQISTAGGSSPAWARAGRSLYFVSTTTPRAMMRTSVVATAGGALTVGPPTIVVSPWPYGTTIPARGYDVFPDGSFLATTSPDANGNDGTRSRNKVTEFHVVLNFLSELRARVR